MRMTVAIGLIAGALLAAFSSVGCVPKAQYDELMAINRKAVAEKDEAVAAARNLRERNDQLSAELESCRATVANQQKEINLLKSANRDLQTSFEELRAKADRLAAGEAVPMPGPISIVPAQLDRALREFARENSDLLDYLPEYGMVKFKSDLTFQKGSDFVQEPAKEALRRFVEIVNSPEAAKYNIYIAGHTDDIPIRRPETKRTHPDNWYLSVHRAVAVQKELVRAGLAPARIGTMGFSEYHPIEPNAPGKKGNPANRRVEIWIVPPGRFLTQPAATTAEK